MKLYSTITEVSKELGVNASHLRFLEKEFPEIKPSTNTRGVRHYTQEDITLLRRILYLTKECGYTIEGARQQLRARTADSQQMVEELQRIRSFLVELKEQL